MKNYIKLLLISGGVLFTSCSDDLLEPYTPGQLTEDVAITTSQDLNNLMNAAYAILNSRNEQVDVSVFTDEVSIGFANGGQGISDDYVFLMNPGAPLPSAVWAESYFALARINRVIKLADTIVPTSTGDQATIAGIKAQALTMRALIHLKLLAYFTTDMKDNSAPAAILGNKVFLPTENQNARATNGEFYSLIHSDLDAAIATFDANGTAFSNIAANKWLAKGLKARAYAYKGDYANALTYANDVINNSGIALADRQQYRQTFFSDNQPANVEVIFKFKRTPIQNAQGYNLHCGWASVRPNGAGSPFYEVSRALHNMLNPTNLPAAGLATTVPDVRANVIIAPSSTVDPTYLSSPDVRTTDRLVLNKHGGVATGSNSWAVTASNSNHNDIKIMRLSEMYLIKAEASVATNIADAAASLKAIRDARTGTSVALPVFASQQQAWAAIMNERRVELAFEGHRFIDIKRLGTLANQGIDRNVADYNSATANYPAANPTNMPLSSHKWALPIPQNEINVNAAIQQNPGY